MEADQQADAGDRPPLADLEAVATSVLTALAGPGARLRDDQRTAVEALVRHRRRVLVVQATGWGKSAVYWIATAAQRERGPTLVVSPLLALMRDQVAAARRAGLRAATLNSSTFEDWPAIEGDLLAGTLDVVLVSPERLASPRFASTVLPALLPRLGLLVVDEAHCISSWGHDFRPDYQRLARLLASAGDLPVLATTATANARVTADVAAQLGQDTLVLRGPLTRASLSLGVVGGLDPVARAAWVDTALPLLPGSGIAYVLTVAEAERLGGFLRTRGHAVEVYTGRLDGDTRLRVESALRADEVKVVVATSALGMGFDKPDLGFVLHVGSPASPVDYYQQVGRAGRAIDRAVAVLLPSPADERIWEWFATASVPDPAVAQQVLDVLADGGTRTVPDISTVTGAPQGRVDMLMSLLAVDGAVERVEGGWRATGAGWTYDADRYADLVAARRAEADLMRRYAAGAGCLEGFVRRALDDEVAADHRCGRCSVCTGALPGGLPDVPQEASVDAARDYLRGVDVVLEPRRQWASGMTTGRGRIALDRRVSAGRALAYADDPGWPQVAPWLAGDRDGVAPDWAVAGLLAVLTRWRGDWDQRPVAVVPVPSRTRPTLVASLAAQVAAVGRLPVVEALTVTGPRPRADVAPAVRARDVETSLGLATGVTVPDGPVLLVDDTWRTGWTAAIAAALLRSAGAGDVLPMVLHQRP